MKSILLLSLLFSWSSLKAQPVHLTPQLLVQQILKKNLEVKISHLSEKQKKWDLYGADGKFDLSANYSFNYDQNQTPSLSQKEGEWETITSESTLSTHQLNLSKQLPWGMQVKVPYSLSVNHNPSSPPDADISYTPSLSLNLTQPITQLFSPNYFQKQVLDSATDLQKTKNQSTKAADNLINKALGLFYQLLESQHTMQIKLETWQQTKDNLNFIKVKHKVGKATKLDLLDAESASQKAENEYLTAQSSHKNTKQSLSLEVFADLNTVYEIKLSLDHTPPFSPPTNKKVLLKQIWANDTDIKAILLELDKIKRSQSTSKVDRLPNVSLEGEIKNSSTHIELAKSHGDLMEGKALGWKVGASISHKLPNSQAVATHQNTLLRQKQENIKLKKKKREIALNLEKELNTILNGKRRINALRSSHQAESEKLKAMRLKFENGLLSIFELNRHRQAKTKSEIELLKAKINQHKSIAAYYKLQGKLVPFLLQQL